MRVSSKDAYISPTRGAQGNALKTVLAIPYVLSDGRPDPVTVTSQGQRHTITVALDRIAQEPQIALDSAPAAVRNGTCVEVNLGTLKKAARACFLPLIAGYSCFNPHASIVLTDGTKVHRFTRTTETWRKWRPSDPTSPHWYSAHQLRTLIAAYVHAERQGGPVLFVRDFIGEFRGLASTVKRKAVLEGLPLAGRHLHDLVINGDLDTRLIAKLLKRMQAASTPVPPTALGVLGEAHRLVADALEAAWNDRLRALAAAQEAYEQAREADARVVTDEQRAEILALASDFPRLWREPATSAREKKRMMRLLMADVTLTKGDTLHADIRFTGGATRSLDIPLPKTCVELRTTDAAIVREIDELLDTYTDAEIADLLNERGVRTATMRPFTRVGVIHLRVRYGLKHRRTRMLEAGLLTPADLAARYGVRLSTVHMWRRRGLLRAHPVTDKGEYLYEIPPDDLPAKFAHKDACPSISVTSISRSQRGAV